MPRIKTRWTFEHATTTDHGASEPMIGGALNYTWMRSSRTWGLVADAAESLAAYMAASALEGVTVIGRLRKLEG